MPGIREAREKLREIFGYDSFRKGQEEAIASILSGRDVMAVMPTGAGKSICYQIPALLLDGVTLVVSPLISLMHDQVSGLIQNGVRAAYINSTLTGSQVHKALQNAAQGMYRIIYVAPERLLTENFLNFALNTEIAQVVIDEAHCVSQWGQDFRPAYLQIYPFLRALPVRPTVSAFTATATPEVKEDIERLLCLEDPCEIQTGFDRPNLRFEVCRERDRDAALLHFIREQKEKSGIVYCGTRKGVEEVGSLLREHGIDAVCYHAGMGDELRRQAQEDFVSDRVQVIVATNAFGMGIDKSNVSFVVHYNMPKDLESYYQEAGRAGRDGENAVCCLLYQPSDVHLNTFLIEHSQETSELDEDTQKIVSARAKERLKQMTYYAAGEGCLRARILRYFGETPVQENCGNCSFCLQSHAAEQDVTREAAQIAALATVLNGRYGKTIMTDILKGRISEKVKRQQLDKLALFGCLRKWSADEIGQMIDELVMDDVLEQTEGKYPTIKSGVRAGEILRGDEPVRITFTKEEKQSSSAPRTGDRVAMGADENLFKRLSQLRKKIADEQHVPSFIIFTNATLRDMVNKRPHTKSQMGRVAGVGSGKLERYGERFLAEISAYEEEKQ